MISEKSFGNDNHIF